MPWLVGPVGHESRILRFPWVPSEMAATSCTVEGSPNPEKGNGSKQIASEG